MPETRVNLGEDGAAIGREFSIRVNGTNPTFKIATDRIEARLVAPMTDLLLDLLDVAGVVFCADSTVKRGGLTRKDFGDAWRRSFSFTIPVRCPEVWKRPEVGKALTDAVHFLTDDDVDFAFHADEWDTNPQTYLDFDPSGGAAYRIDEVILFSGGLDSLAGALETLATTDKQVALVSHESAPKIISHQRELAKMLKQKYPGRVLHIPVKAHRMGTEAQETTQRSRSFLFAAIAHVIARIAGVPRILFFENGVVSHNLPISNQVIGTMATRTTHPMSLHLLSRFLDTLGGSPIPLVNGYAWFTKTDVVRKIAEHGGASMIRSAVSCTSVREQSILFTHCGACSQCLDRRVAILAAGLEAEDPTDQYAIDILFDARTNEHDRIIAIDWANHALGLAELPFFEFSKAYIGELTRIVSGHCDTPMINVARRVHHLHQRQGRLVLSVFAKAMAANAESLLRGTLPETSLLRIVANQKTGLGLPVCPTTVAAPLSYPAAPRSADVDAVPVLFPLQVAFYVDGKDDVIRVKYLGTVRGSPASIAHALRTPFEADRAKGLSRENHRFMAVGAVSKEIGKSKNAVRKLVERCRKDLTDFYLAIEGHAPERPILIENQRQIGYRLDPDCRVITPDQIE